MGQGNSFIFEVDVVHFNHSISIASLYIHIYNFLSVFYQTSWNHSENKLFHFGILSFGFLSLCLKNLYIKLNQ